MTTILASTSPNQAGVARSRRAHALPVSDPNHQHKQRPVFDLVENTEAPHPQTVDALGPLESLHAIGAGFFDQAAQHGGHAGLNVAEEPGEVLVHLARKRDDVGRLLEIEFRQGVLERDALVRLGLRLGDQAQVGSVLEGLE